MLKINYEQGNSLDTSYFVAKESGTELRVKASDVIPVKYQKMITDNNAEVVTPEEAIAQMQKENSTIKEFDKFARKARIKNRIARKIEANEEAKKGSKDPMKTEGKPEKLQKVEDAEKVKKTKAQKRKAADKIENPGKEGWSLNPAEIEKPSTDKTPVVSVDEKEAKADKAQVPVPSSSAPKVKKYYGRLPSKSVGGQYEEALDRQSKNITSLNDEIQTLREQLESKDKEIEGLRNSEVRKATAEKVDRIIDLLVSKGHLNTEDEQEREAAVKKYSAMNDGGLDLMIEMLEKVGTNEATETERDLERSASLENGNLPAIFSGQKTEVKTDVETMSAIWDK